MIQVSLQAKRFAITQAQFVGCKVLRSLGFYVETANTLLIAVLPHNLTTFSLPTGEG